MRAQILYGIGNLKYAEMEAPTPKSGEALVKVVATGICGSDVPRIYKTGAHNMPLIPGHEFAGIVESCPDKRELEGKRVGVFPLIPCKECEPCRGRHYEMCKNYDYLGSRRDGGFAEYVIVPVWNLIELPDEVSFEEAAMLEPMSVAVHAMRRYKLRKKENVVICGLGTIGLMLAMFMKDAGFKNLFFIGNKDVQKKTLLEMGFSEESFCDVRYKDPVAFVFDKTGGRGADTYFECIGRPENYEQAVKCVSFLGKIVLVGNPAADMELKKDTYWKILRNQLNITGTWNSSYLGDEGDEKTDDWKYVLSRLSHFKNKKGKNAFEPEKLITHRIRLVDLPYGLDIMKRKSEEYVKIMVKL
jgi:L-iditol 2-dehydrogenase